MSLHFPFILLLSPLFFNQPTKKATKLIRGFSSVLVLSVLGALWFGFFEGRKPVSKTVWHALLHVAPCLCPRVFAWGPWKPRKRGSLAGPSHGR